MKYSYTKTFIIMHLSGMGVLLTLIICGVNLYLAGGIALVSLLTCNSILHRLYFGTWL